MISSYSNTLQTVTIGENLTFDINDVNTNCAIAHTAGTGIFTLKTPGKYYISFNGTFTVSSSDGGLVTVSMNRNNVSVPGAAASTSVTSTTDIKSLSFSKIVQVKSSCCAVDNTTSISFANVSATAVFTNVNVSIWRLE